MKNNIAVETISMTILQFESILEHTRTAYAFYKCCSSGKQILPSIIVKIIKLFDNLQFEYQNL